MPSCAAFSRIDRRLPGKDSVYCFGSVGKTFPGNLLAQAVIDRRISLDDDVRRYLPNGSELTNLSYQAEVIRKLKAAGFVEVRSGKGSHVLLKHPTSGKEVGVAPHTTKDAGRLGNRILREAGVE